MLPVLARRARLLTVAMAASLLHGCGERSQVPDFVERMMDADFPADGRVYAWARGRIPVEQATEFCTIRPGYALDAELLRERLRQMGQSQFRGGSFRGGSYRTQGRAGLDRECIPGQSVFVSAVPADNREGRPYRIVLAVWRGEAACVAAIERPDGRRPGARVVGGPLFDPFDRYWGPRLKEMSIAGDMADLSRVCVARLSRADMPPVY